MGNYHWHRFSRDKCWACSRDFRRLQDGNSSFIVIQGHIQVQSWYWIHVLIFRLCFLRLPFELFIVSGNTPPVLYSLVIPASMYALPSLHKPRSLQNQNVPSIAWAQPNPFEYLYTYNVSLCLASRDLFAWSDSSNFISHPLTWDTGVRFREPVSCQTFQHGYPDCFSSSCAGER